ncbi:MAG: phosphate transport system regulatory protein PhoU [Rhodospirillaceae bacterium]|jgi:phosphate transport system protein|nr:phosphate transport system regulatory protein PhoU [Rhodospirillaceae bacterium]|tara:strand:+ start:927 stop:1658 length:732 start_codon:yes stop_codon:yes gene_type:complete
MAENPLLDGEHIVKSFDDELNWLDNAIAEMGGLAEAQLAAAIDALVRRDAEKAAEIIEWDKRIDKLEEDINNFTVRMLALRQPRASDLRITVAALKSAGDLERIGDYAKNMAKRTITISKTEPVGGAVNSIARMASMVQSMIKNVLDAYVSRDWERAADVRLRDEDVDHSHTSLFRELLTYMMEDPRNITACTHLLFIAKNVERIGDHTTNIAEHIHFMVRGGEPENARINDDLSSYTVVEPK